MGFLFAETTQFTFFQAKQTFAAYLQRSLIRKGIPEGISECVKLRRVVEMFGHQGVGAGEEIVNEDHGVVTKRFGREHLPKTHLSN